MPRDLTNNGNESRRRGRIPWPEEDLEYSKDLHEEHNSYPIVQEKMVIEKRLMAVYQKRVMEDLQSYPSNSKKLVLTLEDNKIFGPLQKPAVICKTS